MAGFSSRNPPTPVFYICQIGKLLIHTNWNLKYTIKQGSQISWLAQTDFAAFGKGVQFISGPPYDETKRRSRLTSPSVISASSKW